MSGECYTDPEAPAPNPTKASAKKQIDQLFEYESMVHSAEDKCSQLKGQLDRIKQLYANQTNLIKTAVKSPKKFTTDLTAPKPAKPPKMMRQNSNQIGTDTSGAALGTINNILAGITRTIEMPQLFHQIKELSSKTSHEIHNNSRNLFGVDTVRINSRSQQAIRSKPSSRSGLNRAKRTGSKLTTKASSSIFSKKQCAATRKAASKTSDKRALLDPTIRKPGIPMINHNSRRILKRARAQGRVSSSFAKTGNNDLVEIYHNVAVKECKSSETDVPRKRSVEKEVHIVQSRVEIPPLMLNAPDEEAATAGQGDENKTVQTRDMTYQLTHTYTQPTVSSRMKKVAKYYMNSFNIKCIPFCTAASVSPSHNIGLNIQQVMSMVKNKQPTMQLSPTLAYNISLAAGRWEPNTRVNPMNSFIESMTSRIFNNVCPLTRQMSVLNYQQLQEVAKTIPERIIEEVEDVGDMDDDAVETQSMIITGPSGDVKVTSKKQTIWSMSDGKRCTCAPQKGVEFQQIINKFNGAKNKLERGASTTAVPSGIKSVRNHELLTKAVSQPAPTSGHPLQNKEKKLKEVLRKLHDEFKAMTESYERLEMQTKEESPNEEAQKELQKLDAELNQKEEEIVMVMSLYKEVLALKEQVKCLKEKTSVVNCTVRSSQGHPQTQAAANRSGGDSTATAGLLNKLLKQVQHFQTHYKKPAVESGSAAAETMTN